MQRKIIILTAIAAFSLSMVLSSAQSQPDTNCPEEYAQRNREINHIYEIIRNGIATWYEGQVKNHTTENIKTISTAKSLRDSTIQAAEKQRDQTIADWQAAFDAGAISSSELEAKISTARRNYNQAVYDARNTYSRSRYEADKKKNDAIKQDRNTADASDTHNSNRRTRELQESSKKYIQCLEDHRPRPEPAPESTQSN